MTTLRGLTQPMRAGRQRAQEMHVRPARPRSQPGTSPARTIFRRPGIGAKQVAPVIAGYPPAIAAVDLGGWMRARLTGS
jgi:hypothetical protein